MIKLFRLASWLFLCSIIGTGVVVQAQEIPTEQDSFTEHVAEELRQALSNTPVSVKAPLTLSVGEWQANLHRIFNFCKTNKQSCPVELNHFVQGLAQAYKESNTPPDKNAIRLIVRTTDYLEQAIKSLKADGPHPISKPFVDGLVLLPVLDTPRAVRSLGDKDLKAMNLTHDELFELGRANLKASIKPLADVAKPVKAGQIGNIHGGIFDPSRLALLSEWSNLVDAQGGTLLVSIPTTDTVLYLSESSPVAIDALRSLSQDLMSKAPNPLSNKILRWTSSAWEVVP